MAVYQALLLNTVVPQIQAAQAGDSYVMVVNATTPALRITQTGTGNALEVEDSANPDATPFVVTAAGDVGIGTNAPSGKLDVSGGTADTVAYIRTTSSTTGINSRLHLTTGVCDYIIQNQNNGGTLSSILRFVNGTSGNQIAAFDYSGNLGLGVTPSAWGGSNVRAIELQSYGAAISSNGAGATTSNFSHATFFNGTNWIQKEANVTGARYQQSGSSLGSAHAWFVAPNSTAGGIITFTQAMTLDASGNLVVGYTAGSYRLTAARSAGGTQLAVTTAQNSGTTASPLNIDIDFNGYSDGNKARIRAIDQSGNTNDSYLSFWTNGSSFTERARITSGGYFKASNDGAYLGSTSAYHELRTTDASNPCAYVYASSGSYTGQVIYVNTGRAATNAFKLISANANSVEQFYVTGDGAIYAQNTTVQSISDVRLKENVTAASEGLQVISALRPVRYDWKEGYGNNKKAQLGFIAQEVEQVFPDAVGSWQLGETEYKTVGPSALIPVLVKAIQEQQAMINELKAEVAALKGA